MSKQLAKKKQGPMVSGSFGAHDPDAIRLQLLAAAGFTPERQAELVKEAIEKTAQAMNATKDVVLAVGNDVLQVPVVDNVARQKARDQIFALTGVNAPRSNATQTVKHIVEIDWPEFMKPKAEIIDVTPSENPALSGPTNEQESAAQ